jgi:hypothetical protein
MAKDLIKELEISILDQIQKLNDDSIMADAEDAKQLIERSKAMSDLTNSYIEIQKTKLDAQRIKIETVRVIHQTSIGIKYEDEKVKKYLGIEFKDSENEKVS